MASPGAAMVLRPVNLLGRDKIMGIRQDEVDAARKIFPVSRMELEAWLLDEERAMHMAINRREWKIVSSAVLHIRRLEKDIAKFGL